MQKKFKFEKFFILDVLNKLSEADPDEEIKNSLEELWSYINDEHIELCNDLPWVVNHIVEVYHKKIDKAG